MKRIYLLSIVTAVLLFAGCMKDAVETTAPHPAGRLTLVLPAQQEVVLTRAATASECRIENLCVLVYNGGELAYREFFAAAQLADNGTAKPSVTLDYSARPGDRIYALANCPAAVTASLGGLSPGAVESGLKALLVCDNPTYTATAQPAAGQPMYGHLVWTTGANVCEMVRSLAKITVEADPALFAGKTLTCAVAGAPEKTSMEVRRDPVTGIGSIPGAVSLAGAWNTAIDPGGYLALVQAHYCAPYPIAEDAGGATVDKNTFDKNRTALLLRQIDASGATEYYRLDFSRQTAGTTPTGDAANEYLDIAPNTHYVFRIRSVRSGGYSTAAEAWRNPGSNIEYTVTVAGDEWKSSTSNGQYLVKSDRDSVFVLSGMSTTADLVKFACQLPDAGQKPGEELPGSVSTCTVTLVGPDKRTVVPVSRLQLCKSDGSAAAGNTFDFSGQSIPADGYPLKYRTGSTTISDAAYVRIRYGNVDHFVPILVPTFSASISTTTFTYAGRAGNTASVQSHYYDYAAARYAPLAWTSEFSTDGGGTWTQERPAMLPDFPISKPGSDLYNTAVYPIKHTFDVAGQVATDDNPHNDVLRAASPLSGVYDLSTRGGAAPVNTANCYIVNAPGTYTFPLVYGNAIKNGATNTSAYTSSASGVTVMKNFVNHLDAQIKDPYIYNNAGCTPADACLVWQDEPGLVRNITLDAYRRNIQFHVPKESIRQGNALIAVRDASGRIMWSWHIWVTDYVPDSGLKQVTNFQGETNTFMPVNIGWCDPDSRDYAAREVIVRITQDKTGREQTFTLRQTAFSATYSGNNPYFQWGRKDPMLPGVLTNGMYEADKSCYTDSDKSDYAFSRNNPIRVTHGTAIQTPYMIYSYDSGSRDWSSTTYNNLWNVNHTSGTASAVVKTIYDPSPAGYCLPSTNVFTGFTYNGLGLSGESLFGSQFNSPYTSSSQVRANGGWEFYCKRMPGEGLYDTTGGTIFFPNSGQRTYVGGRVGDMATGIGFHATSTAPTDYGHYMRTTLTAVVGVGTTARTTGCSVRPMREK